MSWLHLGLDWIRHYILDSGLIGERVSGGERGGSGGHGGGGGGGRGRGGGVQKGGGG